MILSLSDWEDVYPASRYGVRNGTWFWWWWGGRWYDLSMTHWLEKTANIARKWDPGVEVRFGWHKECLPKKLLWKCEENNYSGRVDYIAWREERQGHVQKCASTFHCQGLPTTMQASVLDAALPDPSQDHALPVPSHLSPSEPGNFPEQSPFQDTDWPFNWSFFKGRGGI